MIKTRPDKALKLIFFDIDSEKQTLLDSELTDCLVKLRTRENEDTKGALEMLEAFRIEIRYLHQENRQSLSLPIIETFCTARILLDFLPASQQVSEKRKDGLNELIRSTKETFNQIVGEKEFADITSRKRYPVNYVYVQYLDYSYDKLSKRKHAKNKEALLIDFMKLINDHSDAGVAYNEHGVLMYPIFHQRCLEWMRINQYTDICLEEIIDDALFEQADT